MPLNILQSVFNQNSNSHTIGLSMIDHSQKCMKSEQQLTKIDEPIFFFCLSFVMWFSRVFYENALTRWKRTWKANSLKRTTICWLRSRSCRTKNDVTNCSRVRSRDCRRWKRPRVWWRVGKISAPRQKKMWMRMILRMNLRAKQLSCL